jgi:agmatine/peptidylarginine deiminase
MVDNSRNILKNNKDYSNIDKCNLDRIAYKRKKIARAYYTNKAISKVDKSVKNSQEFKEANRQYANLNNRRFANYDSDLLAIHMDVNTMRANHKKVTKAVEKYRDVALKGNDKKTQKAKAKLEKTIEKSNKITMELADAWVSDTGVSKDGKVYVDYEYLRNSK